jgi:hypothetical protein
LFVAVSAVPRMNSVSAPGLENRSRSRSSISRMEAAVYDIRRKNRDGAQERPGRKTV